MAEAMKVNIVERGGNWFATLEGESGNWESGPYATEEHAQAAIDGLLHAAATGTIEQ